MTELRAVPGHGGRLLAVAGGGDAATVCLLSASSRRSRTLLQHGVMRAMGVLGTRGSKRVVLEAEHTFGLTLDGLIAELEGIVPSFALVGLSVPRQASRRRLIAIGRSRAGLVVVKLDADPAAIEHEGHVLSALGGRSIPTVITPRLVASGRITTSDETVAVVAQSAVTEHRHSPVTDVSPATLDRLAVEIDRALRVVLTDRIGPADHESWVPSHGDLAPWNLRRTERGNALVDWETARWAPPGTDAAYFAACAHVVAGRPMDPVFDDARDHLLAELAGRTDSEDVALTTGLRKALTEAGARR